MKYKILWLISVLPFIVTCCMMSLIPDSIPMHYDWSGLIDRWGSKYENLIFPVIIIVFMLFWNAIILQCKNKRKRCSDDIEIKKILYVEKIVYIAAFFSIGLFSAIHYLSIYSAYLEATNRIGKSILDFDKISILFMGIILIVGGCVIPNTSLNSFVGIRTKWSMIDDEMWKITNRFSGPLYVVAGIVVLLVAVIFKGVASVIISIIIMSIVTTISTLYSYLMYKKSKLYPLSRTF